MILTVVQPLRMREAGLSISFHGQMETLCIIVPISGTEYWFSSSSKNAHQESVG